MVGSSCCVVNCGNTSLNSKCQFYRFPTASHKLAQRQKWITAVRRTNPDGSQWFPKPYNVICSADFFGNKKAEEAVSPSYIPTIFPFEYKARQINETASINRHNRFMKRRLTTKQSSKISCMEPFVHEPMERAMERTTGAVNNRKQLLKASCVEPTVQEPMQASEATAGDVDTGIVSIPEKKVC